MKRLILMRHAKTEPWFQGGDDRARALLPRGKSDAALVAAELVARGWAPDLVVVSSARRTMETWTSMAPALPLSRREAEDGLYLAGTRALEDTIIAHQDVSTLMLLGHNPGIHDLAASVASQAGTLSQKAALTLAAKMPAAAAALFESEQAGGFDPAHFRLCDFIVAKRLRPEEQPE